jgi:tetratricopeptide (TPR) repeat protein
LLVEKLPFAVLVAAFAFRAAAAQNATGALASMEALSIAQRTGNALRGGMWYIAKSALPTGLGVFYPLSPGSVPVWRTAVAAALLAVISLAVLRVWHNRPQAVAGWLWFALTLLPVSGLVQTGSHGMADRFAYIPLAGLLVMASGFLVCRRTGSWRSALPGVAIAVAVVALSGASYAQTRHWRDELSLFGRALAVSEVESPLIRNHLAEASERAGDYEAALRHHRVALQLRPDWALTHRGLGRLMARQGDFDSAEWHLREAVGIDSEDTLARADLDDLLRCRLEPATAAACLAGTILARVDDRRP